MKAIKTLIILALWIVMVLGCACMAFTSLYMLAPAIALSCFGTWHALDLIGYVWTGEFETE